MSSALGSVSNLIAVPRGPVATARGRSTTQCRKTLVVSTRSVENAARSGNVSLGRVPEHASSSKYRGAQYPDRRSDG